ncbi:MAG: alkylation response protein AidB-like acyl-CoA dehydrogenase [Hyphomicrobiaceae bacterium]
MDFDFSEEQYELRTAVRDYVCAELPTTLARSMWDDPRGFTDEGWAALAALGWLGLSVPEAHGGSGLGTAELILVCEAMGTTVAPGPFWSTVALGAGLVKAAATEEQRSVLLGGVVDGSGRITAAVAEANGRWDANAIGLVAKGDSDGGSGSRSGSEWQLSGEKLFVPDARSAATILIAARIGNEIGLFAIASDTPGLTIEPMITVDGSRKFDVVVLDGVKAEAATLLGGKPISEAAFDAALDVARLALAAELAGIAEASLALSVEYALVREQFGRAIGTFQSIQHKCADMKVDVENTKSLVYFAAWALDQGHEDARRAVAMAKAHASEVCPAVVAEAIQILGGIGFTWEHDLHMYFKRAKADEVLLGDGVESREFVARSLGLGV